MEKNLNVSTWKEKENLANSQGERQSVETYPDMT